MNQDWILLATFCSAGWSLLLSSYCGKAIQEKNYKVASFLVVMVLIFLIVFAVDFNFAVTNFGFRAD